MKKTINTIFAFTFLLLSLSLVNASGEFDVFAKSSENSVCACSTFTDTLLINNYDTTDTIYYITVGGSGAKYITQVPKPFTISKQSSKKISILGGVPCGTTTDSELEVTILTNKQTNKTILRKVNVETCDPVSIFAKKLSQKTDACEEATYNLAVKNTATYMETYSLESNVDDVKLPSTFSLLPGEIKELEIKTNLSCDVNGQVLIPVKISSKYTHITKEIVLEQNISANYDFKLNYDDKSEVCTEDESQIKFTLENDFKETNSYNVKIIGEDFLTLSESNFTLESGDKDEFYVNVKTAPLYTVGDFTGTIIVTEKLGGTFKEYNFSVKLNDCYNYEQNLMVESATLCRYEKEYNFNVKNIGDENTFNVYFDMDYPFLKLSETNFTLNSDEEKSLIITLNPNEAQSRDYNITITTEDKYGFTKSSSFEIKVLPDASCYNIAIVPQKTVFENSGEILIKVKNVGYYDDILNISLNSTSDFILENNSINLPKNSEKEIKIKFNTTNTTVAGKKELILNFKGIEDTHTKIFSVTYNLAGTFITRLAGLVAIFLVLGVFIGMKSGEQEHGKKIIFGVLVISLIIALISFGLSSQMSVLLQYCIFALVSLGIFLLSYLLTKVLRTIGKKGNRKPGRKKKQFPIVKVLIGIVYVSIITCLSYVAIMIPSMTGFALLAVGILVACAAIIRYFTLRKVVVTKKVITIKEAKAKKKPKVKRQKINLIPALKILAIFLIIAASAFTIYSAFNVHSIIATKSNETFLKQEMYFGEVKFIDLNKYFKDPDNDTLDFNVTQKNDSLKVNVNQGLVSIKPTKVGIEQYVIFADDGKGGVSETPTITLNVKEPRLNLFQRILLSLSLLFGLTNIVLFVIVLALVCLALFKVFSSKPKKSNKRK